MDIIDVEKNIGYSFKDKSILQKALTLSSYDCQNNNQSLECLGDAVLGFVVAEKYYNEGMSEGDITRAKKSLVSDEALTPVSIKLGLADALIRGKGDDNNKKAIPSAYEAMTAAIYLDGGMDCAKKFVLATLDFTPRKQEQDYISALQELLQSRGGVPPTYEKEELGTPQSPWFLARIVVEGKVFTGEGGSYSAAKKAAAKAAYGRIK
jgi:ribonuclease-3